LAAHTCLFPASNKCLANPPIPHPNSLISITGTFYSETVPDKAGIKHLLLKPDACCLELISETILTAAIVVYYSADIIKENNEIVVDHPEATPNYLALLTHNGLKEGCICSLMHNMSIQKGLVKNA
jgi:hypothetical protein